MSSKSYRVRAIVTDVGGIDTPCLAVNFDLLDSSGASQVANLWADTKDNARRLVHFFKSKVDSSFNPQGALSAQLSQLADKINNMPNKGAVPDGVVVTGESDTKTGRLWLRLPLPADPNRKDLYAHLDSSEDDVAF